MSHESFNARKAILTGDIQVAKGDKVAAKNSFEQAKKSGSQLETTNGKNEIKQSLKKIPTSKVRVFFSIKFLIIQIHLTIF